MNGLEVAWYSMVALACLMSVADWRKGIYVGILIDVLRDPVRKLLPEQPVLITLSGAIVWGVIVFAAVSSQQGSLRELYRQYPRLKQAMLLLALAIIPAAGLTTISYSRGWLVALIGASSYVLPAIGVLAGYAFLRGEAQVKRLLRWYIIVNMIMLVSVPMEYLEWNIPALGGIEYDWIRYRTGYIVDLMCGWYRSPDIMGLHAAHVIMFSLLLAIRSRTESQLLWLGPVLFAGFCVLVSGRRKMIGVPLVFLTAYVGIGMFLGMRRLNRLAGYSLMTALTGAAIAVIFWDPSQSSEYTDFASSLFTEGASRSNEVIVGSTIGTLQQLGILGAGLGTATQGRYYVWKPREGPRTWQEDGVSRLFVEFGVPGVLLLCIAFVLVLTAMLRALRSCRPQSNEQLLQVGLISVVIGDAASFAISHQQFSGDPVSGLLVTLLVGMVLRFSRLAPAFHLMPVRSLNSESAAPKLTDVLGLQELQDSVTKRSG
ncbi:MAG: hypothetical protein KDA91_05300 [Planctomycetaceae bacterium]|nr:hypothetical protein [Planctomycetaceae bacterium]